MKDTIGVQNIKMSCTTLDKSVTEEETPPLLRRINTFGSSNLKVLLIKFKLIQFNPALMKNQEVTALRQPFIEGRKTAIKSMQSHIECRVCSFSFGAPPSPPTSQPRPTAEVSPQLFTIGTPLGQPPPPHTKQLIHNTGLCPPTWRNQMIQSQHK
jgi:hypothetical protein